MDLVDILNEDGPRFIFVGGKGGVGKTTCAAATAVRLADEGYKILIISTDPAHSLGHSLYGVQDAGLSNEPTKVFEHEDGGELWAVEYSVDSLTVEQMKEITLSIYEAAGVKLSSEEIEQISVGLTRVNEVLDNVPKSQEIQGLPIIAKYMQSALNGLYDVIVFDTAPTGHTLQLLKLPEMTSSLGFKAANAQFQMKSKIRNAITAMKTRLNILRRKKPENKTMNDIVAEAGINAQLSQAEEQEKVVINMYRFFTGLSKLAELVRDNITNEEKTLFIPVTIPTYMALYETENLLDALDYWNVPTTSIIINNLASDRYRLDEKVEQAIQLVKQNDPETAKKIHELFTYTTRIIEENQKVLEEFKALNEREEYDGLEEIIGFEIVEVKRFAQEIIGLERLREFAKSLYDKTT